jgi:hypothetical protein
MPDQDEDHSEDLGPEDLDDLGDLGGGDDEPEQDDEPDDDGEYKPPSKSEWNRTQRRIKKLLAKDKAANGKPVADVDRQLQRQIKGKADDDDADDAPDTSEADRWRGIAVQNAAASQIAAAGFTGTAKQAARLARLIDMDEVTPNRDGTFDLEDEIEELQEEYPQLFQAATGRRPAPSVRRADNRQAAPKDPTRATSDALLASAGLRKRR